MKKKQKKNKKNWSRDLFKSLYKYGKELKVTVSKSFCLLSDKGFYLKRK